MLPSPDRSETGKSGKSSTTEVVAKMRVMAICGDSNPSKAADFTSTDSPKCGAEAESESRAANKALQRLPEILTRPAQLLMVVRNGE